MSRDDPFAEHGPLFLMAGLACLLMMPVIYLATRPFVWLHAAWTAWLLLPLLILVPFSAAFTVIYRSGWHREWPRARRIFSSFLSSCVVFGIDVIFFVVVVIVGSLITALARTMGGN